MVHASWVAKGEIQGPVNGTPLTKGGLPVYRASAHKGWAT